MSRIQIYSPQSSTAFRYACNFIFKDFFGCDYDLVSSDDDIDSNLPILNYSSVFIEGSLQIVPNYYLFKDDLLDFPPVVIENWEGLPVFYSTDGDIPFDIFSAIFFLLSRIEEYQPRQLDVHGRFLSRYSVFAGTGIIQRPVVDEWLVKFKDVLSSYFKKLKFSERKFTWINTYDIDIAYAYRGRKFYRWMGANVRDLVFLKWKNLFGRISVNIGLSEDPFDTYSFQKEIMDKYKPETYYFFLLGNKERFDPALHYKSRELRRLIKRISTSAEAGIHPSYASHKDFSILQTEIHRLSSILNRPIENSRQHYLKFSMPKTYQNLITAGIKKDFTMGYSDMPGFRAGTCTPFYFFDVYSKRESSLKVFPLTVMDASLKNYQKLSPSEAEKQIAVLVQKVKAVSGTFVSLWHNDSLSNTGIWKGWREVYIEMADVCASE